MKWKFKLRASSDEDHSLVLRAIRQRKALALKVFFALLLAAGIGAFLLRQFTASAAVALNPTAIESPSPSRTIEIAWAALTGRKIDGLIREYQLDSGFVQLMPRDRIFPYLRSKIVLQPLSPQGSPSLISVSYTASSSAAAVSVANALAKIITQAKAPELVDSPLFFLVTPASDAPVTGIAVSLRYWIFSLAGALIIAAATVLITEWSSPSRPDL